MAPTPKIAEVAAGLPRRKLKDGRVSQVTIVPFYDRSKLIQETLSTLEEAITLEILVTILVVLAMLMHLRSSLLIAGMLPVAVLLCFVGMKLGGVDANIVALSGIAIAIGTMVDIGVVLSENIVQHLDELGPGESTLEAVYRATVEVGGAIVTAVATTVISFLPVFAMEAAEGKLFRPLAYTKTLALLASLAVSLWVLPPLAHALFVRRRGEGDAAARWRWRALVGWAIEGGALLLGAIGFVTDRLLWWAALLLVALGLYRLLWRLLPALWQERLQTLLLYAALGGAGVLLTTQWMPLGYARGVWRNLLLVAALVGGLLGFFWLFRRGEPRVLRWGEWLVRRHIAREVPDPALRERLIPNYRMGCKRILVSNDWYPTLQRDNVSLVTAPIERITPGGIRTADGAEHAADVLVFGTGFYATDNPVATRVFGRGGVSLAEAWSGGEEAYQGTVVHGFPNLFLLAGPNTGIGHTSYIFMLEAQVNYAMACLRRLTAQGAATMEVRAGVQAAYNAWLQQRMQGTVWASGCRSWYMNAHGKVTAIWPDWTWKFWWRLRRCDPADFTFADTPAAAERPEGEAALASR